MPVLTRPLGSRKAILSPLPTRYDLNASARELALALANPGMPDPSTLPSPKADPFTLAAALPPIAFAAEPANKPDQVLGAAFTAGAATFSSPVEVPFVSTVADASAFVESEV